MGIQCTVINFLHSKYLVNSVIITQWTKKKRETRFSYGQTVHNTIPSLQYLFPFSPSPKKNEKVWDQYPAILDYM